MSSIDLSPQELRTLRKIHAAGGKARQLVSGHVSLPDQGVANYRHFEKFKRLGLVRHLGFTEGAYEYEVTPAGKLAAEEAGQ